MTTMRAKLQVGSVFAHRNEAGETQTETVSFFGVAAKSYPADGSDEDNTFARFSPSANFQISIANPALHGQFEPGQKFYVDFTPAQ
ncbi:hypothetical protein [uncultured Novosphingobium sp.]|uniref:hypothetical protein n=1 Tax=uncultured Novosphingobium sp. TaxID=292277 RepID=UPI0025975D6B|nr:hypothetical protein [uncultured Novosphingobium sp.]